MLKKQLHVSGASENIEAAKRTLMRSLRRNERSIMILGSLCATLIKIARLAGFRLNILASNFAAAYILINLLR